MSKVQAILADLEDRSGSDTEVAHRHGVSRGRVLQIGHADGIPPWAPQPKPPAVRSPVFCSDDDLAYLIDHADDPAPDEELAMLANLGPTNAEIAERTGRSQDVIAQSRWQRDFHDPQCTSQRQWNSEEIKRLAVTDARLTAAELDTGMTAAAAGGRTRGAGEGS